MTFIVVYVHIYIIQSRGSMCVQQMPMNSQVQSSIEGKEHTAVLSEFLLPFPSRKERVQGCLQIGQRCILVVRNCTAGASNGGSCNTTKLKFEKKGPNMQKRRSITYGFAAGKNVLAFGRNMVYPVRTLRFAFPHTMRPTQDQRYCRPLSIMI